MAGVKDSKMPDLKAPLDVLKHGSLNRGMAGPLSFHSDKAPPKHGYLTCTLKRGDTYLRAPLFSEGDEEDTVGLYITPPPKMAGDMSSAYAAWQVRRVNQNRTPSMVATEHIEVLNFASRPLPFRLFYLEADKDAVYEDEFKDESAVALTRLIFPEELAAKSGRGQGASSTRAPLKRKAGSDSDDDDGDDDNVEDHEDQKAWRRHRAKRLKAAVLG